MIRDPVFGNTCFTHLTRFRAVSLFSVPTTEVYQV